MTRRRLAVVITVATVAAGVAGLLVYDSPDRRVRRLFAVANGSDDRAFIEVVAMGERAVPYLVSVLDGPDDAWRRSLAAQMLGRIGSPGQETVAALTRMVQHGHSSEIRAAAEALGAIGPAAKEALPALLDAIWNRDRQCPFCYSRTSSTAEASAIRIGGDARPAAARISQEYDGLAAAAQSVDLLEPREGAIVDGADVTFRWRVNGRLPGIVYCSALLTDKGMNPFDTDPGYDAGSDTAITINLDSQQGYQWAVEVTACKDRNVRCSYLSTRCLGRVFRSPIFVFKVRGR